LVVHSAERQLCRPHWYRFSLQTLIVAVSAPCIGLVAGLFLGPPAKVTKPAAVPQTHLLTVSGPPGIEFTITHAHRANAGSSLELERETAKTPYRLQRQATQSYAWIEYTPLEKGAAEVDVRAAPTVDGKPEVECHSLLRPGTESRCHLRNLR
jgi:hypothetical protein